MEKFRVLDLFSGIGGFTLGLERAGGFETVAFCEIEEFPRKVLEKHWKGIPIYEDIRELTRERLESDGIAGITVVVGGFPCQDLSVAGSQEGIDADRSGLWTEMCRIISEIRPRYAIVENVTAILSGDNGRWMQRVLGDLESIRYDTEWHCIPASELGANHHRDRFWLISYPQHPGCDPTTESGSDAKDVRRSQEGQDSTIESQGVRDTGTVPDTDSERLQGRENHGVFTQGRSRWQQFLAGQFCHFESIRDVKPTVCGSDDGIPDYAHRIKALGNAVVPQIPEIIGRAIMEVESDNNR